MKVFVLFADGFEELEAFTIVDILRRANVDVTTVGLNSTVVEGAHKIKFMADKKITDVNTDSFDGVILPGGPGYKNLANSSLVLKILKKFDNDKKYIGAICAAPVALAKAGVLDDKVATIYPGMESEIPKPRDAKIIVAHNVITAKSPGMSIEFSLKLVELFASKAAANKVRAALVLE
jgi:protein deglycase